MSLFFVLVRVVRGKIPFHASVVVMLTIRPLFVNLSNNYDKRPCGQHRKLKEEYITTKSKKLKKGREKRLLPLENLFDLFDFAV
ncbi:MAG: hypothetical protein LBN21_06835, partial [Treponema sp.]|nr:hypothetical protein [Treponema sp.]